MDDEKQSPAHTDYTGGYIKSNHKPQTRVEEVQTWLRVHKDDIMIAGLLVLGYKHRKLRKHVVKLTNVSLEHAKVTKKIAENGEKTARVMASLNQASNGISGELDTLFERTEILWDALSEHREAINKLGKGLKK